MSSATRIIVSMISRHLTVDILLRTAAEPAPLILIQINSDYAAWSNDGALVRPSEKSHEGSHGPAVPVVNTARGKKRKGWWLKLFCRSSSEPVWLLRPQRVRTWLFVYSPQGSIGTRPTTGIVNTAGLPLTVRGVHTRRLGCIATVPGTVVAVRQRCRRHGLPLLPDGHARVITRSGRRPHLAMCTSEQTMAIVGLPNRPRRAHRCT
jgi:hypothetical protein